jgi:hypothetical protein
MSALSIQPTFPIFTDIDGQPLEDGYIFIGAANLNPQTNPIIVYQNAALTTVAVQPIRTRGGYPVFSGTPGRLYVNSDYSIQVQNRNGSVVYSAPAATERYGNIINADGVIYDPPFTNAVQTNVEAKLAQTISVMDFGAVGDGVTDDRPAFVAAIAYCKANNAELYAPSPSAYYSLGSILTIDCPFTAGTYKVFAASPAVTFGTNSVNTVCPEWWGAKADGVTDSTAALNAAALSFDSITLLSGTYLTDKWVVSGFGKSVYGVSSSVSNVLINPTIVKARGTQDNVIEITGHNHVFNQIIFNGSSTTLRVVDIKKVSWRIQFYHCTFEEALPDTGSGAEGILVSNDSTDGGGATLQGDFCLWKYCVFWQNKVGGGYASRGLSIRGSNAFMNLVEDCHFYYCRSSVFVLGGGVTLRRCQLEFFSLTAVFLQQFCQPVTIEECYSETVSGLNFLTMASFFTLSTNPIILRQNYIQSDATCLMYLYNPIVLEHNQFAANVSLNLPGAITTYPYAISIGNQFKGATAYSGTAADKIIRIGDVEDAGFTNVLRTFALSNSTTNGLESTFAGTVTFNTTTILAGATKTSAGLTLAGAALGAFVTVTCLADLQGCVATGYVSAPNTIVIVVQNVTAGNVTLASTSWAVKVIG